MSRIMKGFVMAYLLRCIKYFLEKKHHVSLPKDKILYKITDTGS